MRVFEPIKGNPPSIEWVSVGALQIDESYQRSIETPQSQKLIVEIATNWDWRLCPPLTVSKRSDDTLYIIDGQHRWAAAKMRADIPHLPAMISRFETSIAEAKFFVAVNTARRQPSALDRFHAQCVAGDEESLAIRSIVEEIGLRVGRSNHKIHDREVCCVAIMRRLYRQYGAVLLQAALVDMAEAWPGEGLRCANELLPGIVLLLNGANEHFDPDEFIKMLSEREQSDWIIGAREVMDESPDATYPDEVFRNHLLSFYLRHKVGQHTVDKA